MLTKTAFKYLNIRIIFEGSCDTEDWSRGLLSKTNKNLTYVFLNVSQ